MLIDPFLWQSAAAPSHTSSFGHVGDLLPLKLDPTSLPAFSSPISVLLIYQFKVYFWIWPCLAFYNTYPTHASGGFAYIFCVSSQSLFYYLSTSPLLLFSPHFFLFLSFISLLPSVFWVNGFHDKTRWWGLIFEARWNTLSSFGLL